MTFWVCRAVTRPRVADSHLSAICCALFRFVSFVLRWTRLLLGSVTQANQNFVPSRCRMLAILTTILTTSVHVQRCFRLSVYEGNGGFVFGSFACRGSTPLGSP